MSLLREYIRDLLTEADIRYESGYLRQDGIYHVTAYDGDKQIGTMGLHFVDHDALNSYCRKDYEEVKLELDYLAANYSGPRASSFKSLEVFYVSVDQEYRGTGVGSALYEKALQLEQPAWPGVILVASACLEGSTSPDARRVWNRLAPKYTSSGYVMASVPKHQDFA